MISIVRQINAQTILDATLSQASKLVSPILLSAARLRLTLFFISYFLQSFIKSVKEIIFIKRNWQQGKVLCKSKMLSNLW